MRIDHVVLATSVLPPDVPRLAPEHGLEATAGGRHPGWGTANWIVPLGDAYLELVAVVDEREARGSSFGRWALKAPEGSVIGWAVRPDDLDATAERLGLSVAEGSRTKPSGERVEWRMAGVEEAVERPWLPFFIEWRDVAAFPGATADPPATIVRLELECGTAELSAWLGPHALALDTRPGDAGVTAVVLDGPHGRVTLGRRG